MTWIKWHGSIFIKDALLVVYKYFWQIIGPSVTNEISMHSTNFITNSTSYFRYSTIRQWLFLD